MSQRRVCDACFVRRVKCDGRSPCAGCSAATLDCTRIRPRHKSGPKGIRSKTLEKLAAVRKAQPLHTDSTLPPPFAQGTSPGGPWVDPQRLAGCDTNSQLPIPQTPALSPTCSDHNLINDAQHDESFHATTSAPDSTYPYKVSVEVLRHHLDIYQSRLYPVWPIVDTDALAARLEDVALRAEAYMLASSLCVATLLQLQLPYTGVDGSVIQPKQIFDEIDDLRRIHDFRERPTLDSLSVSFFLHVAYLHAGKRTTSTLLLREAISTAHLLDLHKPTHYEDLPEWQVQEDLRKLWLLFITERAHALQHDLPFTLTISPTLPTLDSIPESSSLSAFTSLCHMFKTLHEASIEDQHTAITLSSLDEQLLQISSPSRSCNELQRADIGVTRQWMRLKSWKLAMAHIRMTTDPCGDIRSMLFPLHLTRDLLSDISALSIDSLEAHGQGMAWKLFEFADSVADIMVCMSGRWRDETSFVSREHLVQLGRLLGCFRGGNLPLLPLLQTRLSEVGLDIPSIPRLIDVTYDDASNDETGSHSTFSDGGDPEWHRP